MRGSAPFRGVCMGLKSQNIFKGESPPPPPPPPPRNPAQLAGQGYSRVLQLVFLQDMDLGSIFGLLISVGLPKVCAPRRPQAHLEIVEGTVPSRPMYSSLVRAASCPRSTWMVAPLEQFSVASSPQETHCRASRWTSAPGSPSRYGHAP